MNGARALLATLVDAGVDVCFANPGTSEMHFVAALDDVPAMRGVLCLFEGVVTGAADGYGRVAGRPAATLAPPRTGARQRAGQPAQRPPGPHPDRQRRRRPRHVPRPLRRAAPVRHRVHRRRRLRVVPLVGPGRRRGRRRRRRGRGRDGPAGLRRHPRAAGGLVVVRVGRWAVPAPAVPAAGGGPAGHRRRRGQGLAFRRAGRPPPGGVGGPRRPASHAASRVAAATGAALLGETFPANLERGRRHPGRRAAGLPGRDGTGPARRRAAPGAGRRQVPGVVLRLSRTRRATWSRPAAPCTRWPDPGEDAAGALDALAEAVGAPADGGVPAPSARPERPTGAHVDGDARRGRRSRRCPRAPSWWTRATPRASSSPGPPRVHPGTTG